MPKRKSTQTKSLFDFDDEIDTTPKPRSEPQAEPEIIVPEPISVTDLTQQIKSMLETGFAEFLVVGEISNLVRPRSGHLYLTLKDDGAQLPAVVWKTTASKLNFDLKDGTEIICRGRLEVYPPHGKYQMIVTHLEPKGIGALELAFRQLQSKLASEGLFRPENKRPIPRRVKTVAVITSPSGAALRDFLQVLGRRTRRVSVRIIPVKVQGDGSALEIVKAIETVNRLSLADCIVVTRGGGSIEDLWAFNEEPLVRAVATSMIPVISAVGHEIDVTLCDLAADLRALTPSEAAERVAQEDAQLAQQISFIRRALDDRIDKRLKIVNERLGSIERHPVFLRPQRMLEDRRRTVDLLEQSLDRTMDRKTEKLVRSLAEIAAGLDALSPLAVLSRGYGITQLECGEVVQSVAVLTSGQKIRTRLNDGTIKSTIDDIEME